MTNNIKKLTEELKQLLNEDYQKIEGITYFNCTIEYPDGKQETLDLPLYINQNVDIGSYDSNIFGVEPQYAVGGYTGDGDIDFNDLSSFKLLTDKEQRYEIPEVFGVTDDKTELGLSNYGKEVTIYLPQGTKLIKVNGEGNLFDLDEITTDEIWGRERDYDYYNESLNEIKEITKDEWDQTPNDYKMIKNGQKYIMYLDDESHATVLAPCKIIDEVLSKNLNEEDVTLNNLSKEEVRNIIDGNVDSEDYWRTEPKLFDKVFSYIQELNEHQFNVTYEDSEGTTENKTAVILNVFDNFINGQIIVKDKEETEFKINMERNEDLDIVDIEDINTLTEDLLAIERKLR